MSKVVETNRYKPYPSYRKSEVSLIGTVPSHWVATDFKYVSQIIMGQSVSSDEYDLNGRGTPFLQGNAEFGDLYPTPVHYTTVAKKFAERGDILFSVRAPVGAINVADQIYGIGRGLCAIRPGNRISIRYIYYLLQILRDVLKSISTGTTYEAVALEDVLNLTCDIPSLDEQRTIARLLDREVVQIDEVIADKERLMTLLQEQRQAIISEAVTKGLDPNVKMKDSGIDWQRQIPEHWKIVYLKRYRKVIDCKHVTADFVQDGYPLASIREVQSDYVDLQQAKQTTQTFYEQLIEGERKPQPGDLIFSRNATVGEVAQVAAWHPPFAMGQDVCLLRNEKQESNSDYLQMFLKSNVVTAQLNLIMVGATFKRINVDDIRNLKLIIPPSEEQQLIVDYLNKKFALIDSILRDCEKEVQYLRLYRQSLISEAVTGKIDVREVKLD